MGPSTVVTVSYWSLNLQVGAIGYTFALEKSEELRAELYIYVSGV